MTEPIRIEKAKLYDKYRLPYAREMVDDLLEHVGNTEVLADIGAGTGQLSRLFVEKFKKIYAIEPNPSMRQVAQDGLKNYPHIKVIDAYAEDTTLSENSIDLIVIGNAFHRFKQDAIEESLRILKNSGWVALVSYSFTNKLFTAMLFGELSKLEGLASRTKRTWHRIPTENLFRGKQIYTLNYPQSLTEDWNAFWGVAYSGIEAPQPNDDDFDRFMEINRKVFDRFSVNNHIRIDYETKVMFGQPNR